MTAQSEIPVPATPFVSNWRSVKDGLRLLARRKVALFGLVLVVLWVGVALFAPLVTAYDPLEENPSIINQGPSLDHPLGTDHKGRDLWSRIAYGSRIVLALAPLSVLGALTIGITLGLLAGYHGGWIDELVSRLIDTIMAFPTILLYLIIISAIGASALNVVIAITVAGAPGVARLVRGLVMDIRTRDYVSAALLRGESRWYVMFVEILANITGPLIVDATMRVGYAIFAIGTLGFLGLGLPPPSPDWGSMVSMGRRYIWMSPWPVVCPALAVCSLVVGLNLLADGLQEEVRRYG